MLKGVAAAAPLLLLAQRRRRSRQQKGSFEAGEPKDTAEAGLEALKPGMAAEDTPAPAEPATASEAGDAPVASIDAVADDGSATGGGSGSSGDKAEAAAAKKPSILTGVLVNRFLRRVRRRPRGQAPPTLWIGCADSRVQPGPILRVGPGAVFVHRNIGNQVMDEDTCGMSCVQYAVAKLKVKRIVVCGHTDCGAVAAAMGPELDGPLKTWLSPLRDLAAKLPLEEAGSEQDERLMLLNGSNVAAQVRKLQQCSIVREAWAAGQSLTLYGLLYDIAEESLEDALGYSITGPDESDRGEMWSTAAVTAEAKSL